MSLTGILIYCLRAATFAAVACALYALVCWLRGRKLRPGRLVALAYLAALIQITVIRGGVDWAQLMTATRDAPRLVPLQTTLEELRAGAWPFAYHVAGNMIWFVPLGMILSRRRTIWQTLAIGAAVSLGLEAMQWMLGTGVSDVDDVLLNALGALLGAALYQALRGRSKT